jgi:8-oxo-dGTP pyrophosphatase MutT (NUDIX family)
MNESERPAAPTDGDASAGPTHVVTCFVLRRDRGLDELLLVRRSERVRTYRGRWAGVSGYVEPGATPLEQAYVELREETRLAKTDLTLLRVGAPLPVHDAAAGVGWMVHPFLFLVTAPERIQTDWEAQDMRWVAPDVVAKLETVPGLVEALARVYPPDARQSTSAPG